LGDGLVAPARQRATRGRRRAGHAPPPLHARLRAGRQVQPGPPWPGARAARPGLTGTPRATHRALAPAVPWPRRCAAIRPRTGPAAPLVPGWPRVRTQWRTGPHGRQRGWHACMAGGMSPRGLDHPARPERACTTPHGQAGGPDTHRPRRRGRLHGRRDQA
jgi:hypothetical protein